MTRKEVKAALLAKGFPEDVVRKGIARCERWQRAAYGEVDWETYSAENQGLGEDDTPGAFYCREVQSGVEATANKTQFGIYGSGRNRS